MKPSIMECKDNFCLILCRYLAWRGEQASQYYTQVSLYCPDGVMYPTAGIACLLRYHVYF